MTLLSERKRTEIAVSCETCGLHIPARLALRLDGLAFCSVLHEVEYAAVFSA